MQRCWDQQPETLSYPSENVNVTFSTSFKIFILLASFLLNVPLLDVTEITHMSLRPIKKELESSFCFWKANR